MSDLVVLGLKLGYLALLWLFIGFVANVVRTDLFGRKVPAAELAQATVAATPTPAGRPQRMSRKVSKRLPAVLKVTNGAQAGVTVPLGSGILIGRSGDCQLILDDDYSSTRHARLTLTHNGYQVEDLGSTNGTFVNNQRISTPTPFGLDDTLRIGRTLMSVER